MNFRFPFALHNQIMKFTVIVRLSDNSFASFQHRYWRHLLVLLEDFSNAVLYDINKLNGVT